VSRPRRRRSRPARLVAMGRGAPAWKPPQDAREAVSSACRVRDARRCSISPHHSGHKSRPRRTAARLSGAVALLMALSSGTGLCAHDLYRDDAPVAANWYDLVTLFVNTPLLGVALLAAWGEAQRALLVGICWPPVDRRNRPAQTGAAGPSRSVDRRLSGRGGRRAGGLYGAFSLRHVAPGQGPALVDAMGPRAHLVAALHLTMVVPVALLAAVCRWVGERPPRHGPFSRFTPPAPTGRALLPARR